MLELGGRIEHGDEAFDDHVIHFLFGVAEFRDFAGRDDRKVVGDLLAVENPAGFVQARAVGSSVFRLAVRVAADEHRLGVTGEVKVAVGDVLHRLADVGGVIFREVAGIGPRVGDHLVLFIERLGDLQGAFGGKRGFALERGEIVEPR